MSKARLTSTRRFSKIGVIRKTHGINGEVLVDDFARTSFVVGMSLWVVPPTSEVGHTRIVEITERGDSLLLKLEGVDDLCVAKELGLRSLLAKSEDVDLQDLEMLSEENEFLGILGFSCFDEQYGDVGVIVEIIETKANDILVIDGKYGEILLPIIDETILGVDEKSRRIDIKVLEGLIED